MVLTAFLLMALMPLENQQQVVAALQKLKRVEVRFHQLTYSDFMDETRADGLLRIQRPGKLRMDYTAGERKQFICDGIIYYENDILADTESRVAFDELHGEPLVRLLLFGDNPLDHFQIKLVKATDESTVYRLEPIGEGAYYIEVQFDRQWLPQWLEVFGEDGEGTRFVFSQWNLEPTFSDSVFVVPPPQN